MPSSSEKQAKFMAASCNNKEFAKKAGMDQKVACEYHRADKRSHEFINKESVEDVVDTVTLDVPTLIRIMEFAREDAGTDENLHVAAERMVAMAKNGQVIDMTVYPDVVKDLIQHKDSGVETLKDSIIKLSIK